MPNLPAGPKASPWWQLLRWIVDPLGYLDECAGIYGDVFTVRLQGFCPFVFISDPELIQQIFGSDGKQFDAGRGNTIVTPLVGTESILLMDGDRHRRERKLLMPSFHGERIATYSRAILDVTRTVIDNLNDGDIIDTRAVMQDITLEIILQVVFGLKEGDRYLELKPLLADMLDMTDSPARSSFLFFKFLQRDWGELSPWGKMLRRRGRINTLLQQEIDERRSLKSIPGHDILSLMMLTTDENGEPLTDKELQDEALTLLIAGHETTATSLAWALYRIAGNPAIKERLTVEISSSNDPSTFYQLPYLTAVCNETLRYYPVTPMAFARYPRQEIELGGYNFDRDVGLVPSIYLTHRREDLYPRPLDFNPDRFLDRSYSPFEFIPFGGGNRRCLGYALAMLEMKLILATIIARIDFTPVDNRPVKPSRRGVTIAPGSKINLEITKKSPLPDNIDLSRTEIFG